MTGPPVVHPVDHQSGEAIHELSGDGVNSADPIVFVNFPVGLDRLMINLGFVLIEFVPVGLV
jgi:hypothetical protein